ncbi:MAG: universal stress protein [Nocardioidaceae bacterium]
MDHARIVVGVNHTPAAEAALRWALAKAERVGCSVTALHVFDEAERADLAMERDPEHEEVEAHSRAQARVREIVSQSGTDIPVTFTFTHGNVAAELAAAARSGTALVVGQPQRDHHRRLVRDLALEAPCPVVAVTEFGHATTCGLTESKPDPADKVS